MECRAFVVGAISAQAAPLAAEAQPGVTFLLAYPGGARWRA
jgi:hypothetical protein